MLMKLLKLDEETQKSLKIFHIMIQYLHNALLLAGLTLGHSQTMERYYTYYSFMFKKSYKVTSLFFYLYKILV